MRRIIGALAAAGFAAVIAGCVGPVPTTPSPLVEVSPTAPPVATTEEPIQLPIVLPMPDRCDLTNGYHLVLSDEPFYMSYQDYQTLPSPDGSYILYNDHSKAYLKESGSTDNIEINDSSIFFPYDALWSSDGKWLAFAKKIDFYANQRDYDIVIADLRNGLSGLRLTTLPGVMGVSPHVRAWSPDGEHLAIFADGNLTEPPRMFVWTSAGEQIYVSDNTPSAITQLERASWSLDGKWFAYLWSTFDGSETLYSVSLVSDDGTFITTLDIDRAITQYFNAALIWSADSKRLAVIYGNMGDAIRVISPESGQIVSTYVVPQPLIAPPSETATYLSALTPRILFDDDNQSILAWTSPDARSYQLWRWSDQFPRGEVLLTLSHEPKFPTNPLVTRIGTYSGSPGSFRVDLINPDASENQPLIQNAVDAGDPDWSPTGQTVAVVWTRESGEARHVSLSWADPYGNSYHQIDTDYVDIQNLHWSPDGLILTFIGVSYPDYTFSVDVVDIDSGSHKVLTANLSNVIYPRYEDQGVFYTVRWRSIDGQQGFDGFDRDGSQLFHIVIDGDVARASELFLSPDRSMAAIKIRRNDSEELQLARLDGSAPVTVRSSLSGLGDPLWSPDGQFVGFTYSVNKSPVMFVIANTDGQEIWSPQPPVDGTYYPINAYGSPLEWVACK